MLTYQAFYSKILLGQYDHSENPPFSKLSQSTNARLNQDY